MSHDEEAEEVSWPSDYSSAIDFLTPLESDPQAQDDSDQADPLEAPPGAAESLPGADPVDLQEDPEEVDTGPVHIEEMSEAMQEAWRRLRLSGPFRPLQFLAWEQSGDAPFPTLRVHDLDVVLIDDPYAELRAERAALEAEAGLEAEDELPPPIAYYRLDGAVTLRRTRFLHLDLDIELRDPLYVEAAADAQSTLAAPGMAGEPVPTPSAFRVYRLEQSRQVKTGKMNYFDGPALGVLAYLTPVEAEPPPP